MKNGIIYLMLVIGGALGSGTVLVVQSYFPGAKPEAMALPEQDKAERFVFLDEDGNPRFGIDIRAHFEKQYDGNVVSYYKEYPFLDKDQSIFTKKNFGKAYLDDDLLNSFRSDGDQLSMQNTDEKKDVPAQTQVNLNIGSDVLNSAKSDQEEDDTSSEIDYEVHKVNYALNDEHSGVKKVQISLALLGYPIAKDDASDNRGSKKNPTKYYKEGTSGKMAEWKAENRPCIESYGPFNPSGDVFNAADRACMNQKLIDAGFVKEGGILVYD